MSRARLFAVIALLSASLLGLELAWTRIFSAELYYSFAFLILSLAVLGLGLGGLALRLWPALVRERTIFVALVIAGATTLAAPALVLHLGLDFSRLVTEPLMVMRLLAAVLLTCAAFLAGGVALACAFRLWHADMPRLYMADLLGGAAGVLGSVWLMNAVGTPAATLLAALPLLAAAVLSSRGWWRLVPTALAVIAVVLVPRAPGLLTSARSEEAPVIYSHWDAMAKIKVFDYGEARGINIDNMANTPVLPFSGRFDDPLLKDSEWGIDFSWLVRQFAHCRFVSLGSGGGGDVLQALVAGAAEVHAVEVNPHINRMLLEGDPSGYLPTPILPPTEPGKEPPPPPKVRGDDGHFITDAEYSGYLYRDSRVHVVSEDARTYLRRHHGDIDVIFSLSSNTWAALGSGSFAFAESYLFTREAFADYWRALADDGFLAMEHQVYMPRLVPAVLEALAELGVDRPETHLAVYDLPKLRRNILLLAKRPLTDDIRTHAFGALTPEHFDSIHLLWPPDERAKDNLVQKLVTAGWRTAVPEAPIEVSPATDDRPFVAQLGRWRGLDPAKLKRNPQYSELRGFPLSQSIILVILAVIVVLVLPLNLVPFLRAGPRLSAPTWVYFFTIGLAFMMAEVVLIQKYALVIGASVHSIVTVLLVLLLSAGIGSRFSDRLSPRVVFAAIALLLTAHALGGGPFAGLVAESGLTLRVCTVALLVAPLGFFMGMPFPKGTVVAGELVDWAFAINGAASVIGATAVMLLVFAWGFTAALLAAASLYLGAWALLTIAQSRAVAACRA